METIKRTCPSPCNTAYEFTEQDKKWATSNTYCPKCHSKLAVQYFQKEFNDKKSRGELIYSESRKVWVLKDNPNSPECWEVNKKGEWLGGY